MEPALLPLALLAGALLIVAVHQWLLDSPLFEFGTASRFPHAGDLRWVAALSRAAVAAVVPLAATLVAAALVLYAPFDAWVPGVVALLAATVALSPLVAARRYAVREPTPEERRALAAVPALGCEVVVVVDAHDGPVNGYAIGGPFRDVVGVSAFALAHLPPAQVAALVAHEAAHHRERHVLVRGGASVAVLGAGAVVATATFDALVPAAAAGLFLTVVVERLVALRVARRTEFRADAVAARNTSPAAVVALLSALDDATAVDQARVPRVLGLFSTHPTYAARVARVQAAFGDADEGTDEGGGADGAIDGADGTGGDENAAGDAGQTPASATPR